jgi:hypothetical protein
MIVWQILGPTTMAEPSPSGDARQRQCARSSDLRRTLVAGQIEKVRSALAGPVGRTEIHEGPRPRSKRLGARLVLPGRLDALQQLAGNVTHGGSPGGIRTLVTTETPAREWRLQGRYSRPTSAASDRHKATSALQSGSARLRACGK